MSWRARRNRLAGRRLTLTLVLVGLAAACAAALAIAASGTDVSRDESRRATATAGRLLLNASSPPSIMGIAQIGQRLTASPGTWSPKPRSFRYAWKRCDARGGHCKTIRSARGSTYIVGLGDAGTTLRVAVTAIGRTGRSKRVLSARTAVVTTPATGVQRLEYVFDDGLVSVYDMDHGHNLVKTIRLPQTEAGVRGVMVSPVTHMLFVSYGGDGDSFHGSVLAYDLLAERVAWAVHLNTGIDSGAVSPDGKRIYMPTGENSSTGLWNVLDASNGAVIGTIQGGAGPHNTIASKDGRFVYLGGRNHNYLDVYETANGHIKEVGPLVNGVRPFTVNGTNTIAFTTATNFDGFQVSNLTTGKVLYTVSFGAVPNGFRYTAPSHGISLSPDETQVYVIDAVNKVVRAYDVSGVAHGVAPRALGSIYVAGWNGQESPCAYDCGQDGWLQHSLDGRYVYVGDSGEVIDTATRKVLLKLTTLANTRKFLEIDWQNGLPIATSTRSGVGYVG
jgi:hypothetical protein